MTIDFEDDGASFRIRRQRQVNEMFQSERVVVIDGRSGRVEKQRVPIMMKIVFWPVGLALVAFLGTLAFCVIDFILWCMGFSV